MTTIEIDLPDALAKEAANAGLLVPERIALILREQLRVERLTTIRHSLAAAPLPPMTPREISDEIDAYRLEQRRAAGS